MPSWNIHIAQTERLLERTGALANSVRDRNAFLFGCVVPDIFVGYMVPGIADPIPYRITHFAKPEPIPKPREHEFWDTYVAPLLKSSPTGAVGVGARLREVAVRGHHAQIVLGAVGAGLLHLYLYGLAALVVAREAGVYRRAPAHGYSISSAAWNHTTVPITRTGPSSMPKIMSS